MPRRNRRVVLLQHREERERLHPDGRRALTAAGRPPDSPVPGPRCSGASVKNLQARRGQTERGSPPGSPPPLTRGSCGSRGHSCSAVRGGWCAHPEGPRGGHEESGRAQTSGAQSVHPSIRPSVRLSVAVASGRSHVRSSGPCPRQGC